MKKLTERQREALQLYAKGHATPDVARLMGVATKTVYNVTAAIYERLEVTSIVPAILVGAERDEITLGESSGTWFCPVHAGVGNEDDTRCDYAEADGRYDEDGEPYPCDPRPLFYFPKETDR